MSTPVLIFEYNVMKGCIKEMISGVQVFIRLYFLAGTAPMLNTHLLCEVLTPVSCVKSYATNF